MDEPLSGNELMGDVTSIIEPLIRTGICVETQLELAVIVAVRVEMSVAPAEKPTLPLPLTSVTTDPEIRIPVATLDCTAAPYTTPPFVSNAVNVIVEVSESSDLTLAALRCHAKDPTCGVAVGGVVMSGDFAPTATGCDAHNQEHHQQEFYKRH